MASWRLLPLARCHSNAPQQRSPKTLKATRGCLLVQEAMLLGASDLGATSPLVISRRHAALPEGRSLLVLATHNSTWKTDLRSSSHCLRGIFPQPLTDLGKAKASMPSSSVPSLELFTPAHPEIAAPSKAPFPKEALPLASGYLPISPSSGSELFFCYYEARSPSRPLKETPIILWLNGGPGCSSMIGNFYELGPYTVNGVDGTLEKNEHSWNSSYGVIFIDNPIGTGFSRAAAEEEIPLDQETCASHLLHGLLHFFHNNPVLCGRPLFLTGESYAGKYVPSLACRILDELQADKTLPFQFTGIAIGNGFTDPRTQVQVHAEVMRSFGMLDEEQAAYVDTVANEVVELVDRQQWVEAHHKRTALCEWIEHTAGVPTLLDIRRHAKYHATEDGVEYLALFLNRPQVKSALKTDPSVTWVSCRPALRLHMAVDTMKSYKHMVERVLESGVPTLLFQGMYDAKDGPLSSERWMRKMDGWDGLGKFLDAPRSAWRTKGGRLAGYSRESANLKHVVVIGAGHQVPADQPETALEMIKSWVEAQVGNNTGNGNHFQSPLQANL